MSGGSFDLHASSFLSAAEDVAHFVKKQQMYRDNLVNPNLPTGDWDYELSEDTLAKIAKAAEHIEKSAKMFELVDALVSNDSSEETFNDAWNKL
jgi:hypothetical protein